MAASCGRSELCQWLISVAGANINARDLESGYTPLHRAVFYGHVRSSVRLMQVRLDTTNVFLIYRSGFVLLGAEEFCKKKYNISFLLSNDLGFSMVECNLIIFT